MAVTLQDIKEYKSRRNRIALLSALADMDPMIREAAVIALIEIADVRDVVAVKEYLMLESNKHICRKALHVVQLTKIYDDSDFIEQLQMKTVELSDSKSLDDLSDSDVMIKNSEINESVEDKEVKQRVHMRMLQIVLPLVSLLFLIFSIAFTTSLRWLFLLLALASVSMAIGSFVVGKSVNGPDDAVVTPDMPPVESEPVKKQHFTRLFHHREIFAMAILYEGQLSNKPSVIPSEMAYEVIEALHQQGLMLDSRLSVHAVVKMDVVAGYKFFSSEDYQPGADLDKLLQQCMDDVKKMVVTEDPLIEKVAAQMSRVKVRTSTLGVVWVGMFISMI